MQFQRALFRLHERCLSCKDCGAPLLALATLSYLLFLYFAFLIYLSADFLDYPNPVFLALTSQLTSSVNPIVNNKFNFNVTHPSALTPLQIKTNDTETDLDVFRTPDFIPYEIYQEDLIQIFIIDDQRENLSELLRRNTRKEAAQTGSAEYFEELRKINAILDEKKDKVWMSHVYSTEMMNLKLRDEMMQVGILKQRLAHNITKHFLFITKTELIGARNIDKLKSLLDMDAVMINLVAFTFRGWSGFLKNIKTQEIWNWNKDDFELYSPRGQHSYFKLIWFKICRLISIFFGFWLLSALVALSLRVFLFCASIVIFPIYFCCPHEFHFSQLLRAMPWFGFYAAYYSRSGRRTGCLACSLFSFFLFFYIVFNNLAEDIIVNLLLFKSFPHQFIDLYLVALLIPEFISFLFIRTRTSIKYFPKIIMCLHLMLLVSVRSQFYSFSLQATGMLIGFQGIMIAYFLNIQRRAVTQWDQFSMHAPSLNNPRCAYSLVSPQHFFIHLPLWTMFKSVRFRHTFKEEEKLAFDQLSEDELLLRYNFDDYDPDNIRIRAIQVFQMNQILPRRDEQNASQPPVQV